MITIFAPAGIGEVEAGADLAALVVSAVDGHPEGPLRDGDIVVITSKIVSKAEGRVASAAEREQAIEAETARTVARRDPTRIVRTTRGLTLAAAGVDNSNVARGSILLLPTDPDRSAHRLRDELTTRYGVRLGVLISDTAGRPWRVGQTDHAIGAAGIRVIERYTGSRDQYGNSLQITAMAVGDELAAAADLVKGKLSRLPVAVIRGLDQVVTDDAENATSLLRPDSADLFRYGSREAVLAAVLEATGQAERYEELVGLGPDELVAAVLSGCDLPSQAADLLMRILGVAHGSGNASAEGRTAPGDPG
jgi:coenzyme F420-0:L-glutamate ligase / coenzyme F420-1:gamma-L-glutamate ligase